VFETRRGVPQGSALSPALYNLSVNPLVHTLHGRLLRGPAVPAQFPRLEGVMGVRTQLYADDQALLGLRGDALQEALDVCEGFASDRNLRYNPAKSVVLAGRPNSHAGALRDLLPPPPQEGDLALHGQPLPLKPRALYLGIPFEAGSGIDSKALAAKNALSMQRACAPLYSLRTAGVSSAAVRRMLYVTYARPCAFYGCQVAGYSATAIAPMQLVEDRALRLTLSAPASTSSDAAAYLLRVPRLADQIDYLVGRYAVHLARLPTTHPSRASAERTLAARCGRGKELLQLGKDVLIKKQRAPPRPKDSESYWRERARASGSQAAAALIHIINPASATHKIVLAVDGSAGVALRLHLLNRMHPDGSVRGNPDYRDIPLYAKDALQEVADDAGLALRHNSVRFADPVATLDPVHLLVMDILAADPAGVNKLQLLARVGTALASWRATLKLQLSAVHTSSTSSSSSSSTSASSSSSSSVSITRFFHPTTSTSTSTPGKPKG